MSESHSVLKCDTLDYNIPARKQAALSYHSYSMDEAQYIPIPMHGDDIDSSLGVYDDVEDIHTYGMIDGYNIGAFPTANLSQSPIHPSSEFVGHSTCFTQGYSFGEPECFPTKTSTEVQVPSPSQVMEGVAFSGQSDDVIMYGCDINETNNSRHASCVDISHTPPYSDEPHSLSIFSQHASRSSSFSSDATIGSLPREIGLECGSGKWSYEYSGHPSHSHMTGNPLIFNGDPASISLPRNGDRLCPLSPPSSSPPLRTVDVRAPSLFGRSPKRAYKAGKFSVSQAGLNKVKRQSKNASVQKIFPSIHNFEYDPGHEYDPFVKPTSAAMAFLMTCLKPTKKDQEMVLKENKRQFWQPTSTCPQKSYVERILASETLITMLFKSKKGPIACNHCNLNFENYLALAGHFDDYNVARPGRCKDKDCLASVLGFASPSEQSRHGKTQHGSNSYKCNFVGCTYHSPRLDCVKRHHVKLHGFEANPRHISKEVHALKDLPRKFQDVKKSKTLTDEQVRQQVAPVLAKLRELM